MANNEFWWSEKGKRCVELAFQRAEALEQQNIDRYELYRRNTALYDPRCDFLTGDLYEITDLYEVVEENIVKSVIDTFQSMLGREIPHIRFQTDGASYSRQRRAKAFEHFVDGEFQRIDARTLVQTQLFDGMLYGTGVIAVGHDYSEVFAERVLIDEILVDNKACRNSPPREVVRRKVVDKNLVAATYGRNDKALAKKIMECAQAGNAGTWAGHRDLEDNETILIELHKLPSYKGAEDGRHLVCLPGLELCDEEWKHPNLPYSFFHWTKPPVGFYGISLVEEVAGTQMRVHKMNEFVDACHDRISVPRMFVHKVDQDMAGRVDNDIGRIYAYTKQPPTFDNPMGVSGDYYQRLKDLRNSPYEMLGVTTMEAQGKRPAGLDSAPAQREYHDITTARHTVRAQDVEKATRTLAERLIQATKDLHASGYSDIKTHWKSPWAVHTIKWSEVEPDADMLYMDIEAASVLSKTPAGRRQDVGELLQSGMIEAAVGRRLLGIPDLEKEDSLANASMNFIDYTIEKLEARKNDEDEIPVPDELGDLNMQLKRATAAYLNARCYEEEPGVDVVIDGFLTFIQQCKDFIDMAAEAEMQKQMEMQAAAAPPPIAGAAGMAPPVPAGPQDGTVFPKGPLAPGIAEGLGQ